MKENVYNYVFLNTQRHRKIEGRGSVKAVEFISECPHSYSSKCLVLYEKGPSEILVWVTLEANFSVMHLKELFCSKLQEDWKFSC